MFGTLLESRARRRRRLGGAAVSTATHLVIIGAVTATTVRGGIRTREKLEPVVIHFVEHKDPPPPVVTRATTHIVAAGRLSIAAVPIHRIGVPNHIPIDLPPIDSSFGAGSDSIVIGRGSSSAGLAAALVDDGDREGRTAWIGADLQTRILVSVRPRYPESLRQAAIDGTVLVRFVIDTTGKVDMTSVAVVSSTHDLFTRAVREALPGFRFKPAEARGQRVRSLAEMPFQFQVTR